MLEGYARAEAKRGYPARLQLADELALGVGLSLQAHARRQHHPVRPEPAHGVGYLRAVCPRNVASLPPTRRHYHPQVELVFREQVTESEESSVHVPTEPRQSILGLH